MPKLNLFERISRATYWVWLIPLIVVVVAIAVINVFIAMSAPGLSIRGAGMAILAGVRTAASRCRALELVGRRRYFRKRNHI